MLGDSINPGSFEASLVVAGDGPACGRPALRRRRPGRALLFGLLPRQVGQAYILLSGNLLTGPENPDLKAYATAAGLAPRSEGYRVGLGLRATRAQQSICDESEKLLMNSEAELVEVIGRALAVPATHQVMLATKIEDVPGWDSIGWIAVVSSLEKHYGIEIALDQLDQVRTVRDVFDLVSRTSSNAPSPGRS